MCEKRWGGDAIFIETINKAVVTPVAHAPIGCMHAPLAVTSCICSHHWE